MPLTNNCLVLALSALTLISPSDDRKDSVDVPRYRFQVGRVIEKGIISGYFNNVEYVYSPLLIELEFQKPVSRRKNSGWYLDYIVQPQLNFVTIRDGPGAASGRNIRGWEAGINAGLVVYRPVFTTRSAGKVLVYALAGTGPHYVSSTPLRQSSGFIFSDNMRIGLRIPVGRHWSIDLRSGIRHISNASLKLPNRGVDNTLVGIGLHYLRL
ncbi:MAG TPA: acyloxyacyl hydrolase [Sphingobacteriaceae bacterium]